MSELSPTRLGEDPEHGRAALPLADYGDRKGWGQGRAASVQAPRMRDLGASQGGPQTQGGQAAGAAWSPALGASCLPESWPG